MSWEVHEADCIEVSPSGCWLWQKAVNQNGYGAISVNRKMYPAHRVYYERHVGAIPDGWHVDHLCGEPTCVNPAHLDAVTQAENNRRSKAAKLTHDDVREIRRTSMSAREVSERYGLVPSSAWRVVAGRTWCGVA